MGYQKQTWKENETVISAARLNHMEDGIAAASGGSGGSGNTSEIENRVSTLEGKVKNIAADIATLQREVDELETSFVEYIFKLVMRVIQLERAAGLQPPVTADGASTETELDESYDGLFGQT